MTVPALSHSRRCADCGTELAPSLLACPSCQALVHRDALEQLAADARAAEAAEDLEGAMTKWREALDLLPAAARQRVAIDERLVALGNRRDARVAAAGMKKPDTSEGLHKRAWGAIIAGGLFLLGKGKFLLLGLTKLKTVVSMLGFFGVYWAIYGWVWALGVMLCIYVHEIGHVAMLARYGVKATAPMFIPGVGALIMLQQRITDPRQDARVGLAGPVWGLGAGLVALAIAHMTELPAVAAVARWAGFLNLFNLLPVWQLDGAHAMKALSRPQRIALALVFGALWYATHNYMVAIVGIGVAVRAFMESPEEGDLPTLATFVALTTALVWLAGTGDAAHAMAAPALAR